MYETHITHLSRNIIMALPLNGEIHESVLESIEFIPVVTSRDQLVVRDERMFKFKMAGRRFNFSREDFPH